MQRLGGRKGAVLAVVLIALVATASIAYLDLSGGGHTGASGGALAAVASTSSASPEVSRYISEYTVGGQNSQPNAIASDSKGDLWYTLAGDYALGELVPGN